MASNHSSHASLMASEVITFAYSSRRRHVFTPLVQRPQHHAATITTQHDRLLAHESKTQNGSDVFMNCGHGCMVTSCCFFLNAPSADEYINEKEWFVISVPLSSHEASQRWESDLGFNHAAQQSSGKKIPDNSKNTASNTNLKKRQRDTYLETAAKSGTATAGPFKQR